MSKILEDRGTERVRDDKGNLKFVRTLVLDCLCRLEIGNRDLFDALNHDLLVRLRVQAHKCEKPKQLPESTRTEVGAPLRGPEFKDQAIEWLQRRVLELEGELRGAGDKYAKLEGIYNKLADQWNAFQATARPDNRNVHRAEAAGEMARKLAECLIGLAYDKDVVKSLMEVLGALAQQGEREVLALEKHDG